MKLTEKMIDLRKKKGLTREDLAEQMNVSRQTISRWEFGEVAPSAENLKKLSKFYAVPLDYLLNDDAALPEPQEEVKTQAPPPAKPHRGVIAILLIIAITLTMAMVIGYISQKGGDTEEIIPVEKLQEKKVVPSPESEFEFTWEE